MATLGVPGSTYYRWPCRFRQPGEAGLVAWRPPPGRVRNRLTPQEAETLLAEASPQPHQRPRELACWITDHRGFSISESTIYRVRKHHGRLREVKVVT